MTGPTSRVIIEMDEGAQAHVVSNPEMLKEMASNIKTLVGTRKSRYSAVFCYALFTVLNVGAVLLLTQPIEDKTNSLADSYYTMAQSCVWTPIGEESSHNNFAGGKPDEG